MFRISFFSIFSPLHPEFSLLLETSEWRLLHECVHTTLKQATPFSPTPFNFVLRNPSCFIQSWKPLQLIRTEIHIIHLFAITVYKDIYASYSVNVSRETVYITAVTKGKFHVGPRLKLDGPSGQW
jgi:hypothetical protein